MPLCDGLDALRFLGPLAFGFCGSFVDRICPLAIYLSFAARRCTCGVDPARALNSLSMRSSMLARAAHACALLLRMWRM